MPSGREEAIETLVDMDPQGNFFRAARILVRHFGCFCRDESLTISLLYNIYTTNCFYLPHLAHSLFRKLILSIFLSL